MRCIDAFCEKLQCHDIIIYWIHRASKPLTGGVDQNIHAKYGSTLLVFPKTSINSGGSNVPLTDTFISRRADKNCKAVIESRYKRQKTTDRKTQRGKMDFVVLKWTFGFLDPQLLESRSNMLFRSRTRCQWTHTDQPFTASQCQITSCFRPV